MALLTNVTFCVVYTLEAVLTLSGNIFTVFVFWKHRAELKRASYLLVNLAFADLLVAISIVFTLIQQVKIALQDSDVNLLQWTSIELSIHVSWDMFCETSSLFNLLVISLERLYALRSPFRHRTLTTKSYLYTLGVLWVFAVMIFVLHLALLTDSRGHISILLTSSFFVVVLAIICSAYTLTCLKTRRNVPEGGRNERRAQQNKRLTKTLFIVTVLSLICWLPAVIMSFFINSFVTIKLVHTNNIIRIIKGLQYANSIVNPIVYSFRMPLFKSEIKKCFSKMNLLVNNNQGGITDSKRRGQDNNSKYFDTKL